jgi:hypothetical protein
MNQLANALVEFAHGRLHAMIISSRKTMDSVNKDKILSK